MYKSILASALITLSVSSASAFGWTDVINEGIADQIAADNAQAAAEEALEADMEKYWYCYDRGLTGNDLLGCKSQFDNNFSATAD